MVPLTVLVGENEAGKTPLLGRYSKSSQSPISLDREWPRGHRRDRNDAQVVCTARFKLDSEEIAELSAITDQQMTATASTSPVTTLGDSRFTSRTISFRQDPPKRYRSHLSKLSHAAEPIGDQFRKSGIPVHRGTKRIAHEGRFEPHCPSIRTQSTVAETNYTPGQQQPQFNNERSFANQYVATLQQIVNEAQKTPRHPETRPRARH